MTILKNNLVFSVYFLWLCLHLLSNYFNLPSLNLVTKPLLVPTLAIAVFLWGRKGKRLLIFLMALFFSFLGDVLLLFQQTDHLFFIFGLVSFLLAHIAYIIFFAGIKNASSAKPKTFYLYIFLIIVYCISLLYILNNSLGALKIPVTIYAIVISLMLIMALFAYGKLPVKVGRWFVLGALLFVFSDSLLAINKFYMPFFQAGFFIMLTYGLAQFCLVKGYVSLFKTAQTYQQP